MDYEAVAQDLVRALRGRRSQRAFSRWLGYSTNVVYSWESGRRYPTAAEALRVASRAKVDLQAALRSFYPNPPPWLGKTDLTTPEGVQRFLEDLRGNTPVVELARRGDLDRHAVGRWLSGRCQPRLPQFLQMVDLTSLRLLDLLAVLVDIEDMPSVKPAWDALSASRRIASALPWAAAVLRALELEAYRALPAHRPGWLAATLGVSREEEARCLSLLEAAGQIAWDGHRYAVAETTTVDTRLAPQAGRVMRQHWSQVAQERIAAGQAGQFSYNVFSVSRADLERLRQMHLDYFRSMRSVIAASEPCEVVAVANVQLFPLEP